MWGWVPGVGSMPRKAGVARSAKVTKVLSIFLMS